MYVQSYLDVEPDTPLYNYGMHFCPACKNLMKPHTANGPLLDFACDKCGKKHTVDYTKRTG